MSKRKIIAGFVLIVAVAVLLYLFWSLSSKNAASPAKAPAVPPVPSVEAPPQKDAQISAMPAPGSRVVLPTAPPATNLNEVSSPIAPPSAKSPPVTAAQANVIFKNLRTLFAAAQQYMLDKGVTEVRYDDIVGTSPDKYIRSMEAVAGEDYQNLVIRKGDKKISLTLDDGSVIETE